MPISQAALMALGAGLMGAGGPGRMPISAAQGAGSGLMNMLQMQQQQEQAARQAQQQDLASQMSMAQLMMQLQAHREKTAQEQRRKQAIGGLDLPPDMAAAAEAFPTQFGQQYLEQMFPEAPDPSERYRVVGSDLYDLLAQGGPAMVARGTRDAGPLVPVFDPGTGQTTYGTREQAVGKLAPPKSGMEVRDAQGNVIFRTGVTGMETMQKPTGAKIEQQMLNLGNSMERLDLISQAYRPEFSQIGTRLGMKWASLKDKAGLLDETDRQMLGDFTIWKARAFEYLNRILNELSGAAVTEHEWRRLSQAAPKPGEGIFDGDSPEEFKSKLDDLIWKTKLAYARLHYYRTQGFPVPDFAAGDTGPLSLESMGDILDARGNELEQELVAQNPGADIEAIRAQVDQQLQAEFGL